MKKGLTTSGTMANKMITIVPMVHLANLKRGFPIFTAESTLFSGLDDFRLD